MPAVPTMLDRIAGQSVMERLFLEQDGIRARSFARRLFGITPLRAASSSWYLGALGEIAVGRMLDQLPSDWTVFHSLPVGTGDSDIDHLVVGPGGVFTINTKHHAGKKIWVAGRGFLVSGQKQPYIRNAEHEADRVTKLLQKRMPQLPPVQPVIALVDPGEITMKEKPAWVTVINATRLGRWLTKRPDVLSETNRSILVRMMAAPDSWREVEEVDPTLVGRFGVLDGQVRSARAISRIWVVAMSLGAAGAFYAVAPTLITSLFGTLIP